MVVPVSGLLSSTLGPTVGDVNGDGVPDLLSVQGGPTQTLIRIYSGIAPGVTMLGSGCPDSLGVVPVLGVGIGPRLGRTMTINLSQAAANATAAMLAVGASNTNWNGVPLPLDLTPLGMPGCQWQVSGDQLLMVPTHGPSAGRQHATWALSIPNDPRLLGISLYSQWMVFEATTSGLSGSVSRSVMATVVL